MSDEDELADLRRRVRLLEDALDRGRREVRDWGTRGDALEAILEALEVEDDQ